MWWPPFHTMAYSVCVCVWPNNAPAIGRSIRDARQDSKNVTYKQRLKVHEMQRGKWFPNFPPCTADELIGEP